MQYCSAQCPHVTRLTIAMIAFKRTTTRKVYCTPLGKKLFWEQQTLKINMFIWEEKIGNLRCSSFFPAFLSFINVSWNYLCCLKNPAWLCSKIFWMKLEAEIPAWWFVRATNVTKIKLWSSFFFKFFEKKRFLWNYKFEYLN